MRDSTYEQPLPSTWHGVAAVGHRPDGSPVAGRWHTYPEMAAAGLWTTPSDLARYILGVCRAWSGAPGAIIGQAAARQMLTATISGHGLGPVIGGEGDGLHFSHSGSNDGYRCFMVGFPAGGDGAVVMTNSDGGNPLALVVARSIAYVYGWPAFQTREKARIAVDPAHEARYVGQYALDDDPEFVFTLTQEADGLGMHWPGKDERAVLHPESATDYFLTENGWQLRFIAADDQPATEFRMSSAEAGFADLIARRVPADSAT
jgi:hypothetical protein